MYKEVLKFLITKRTTLISVIHFVRYVVRLTLIVTIYALNNNSFEIRIIFL